MQGSKRKFWGVWVVVALLTAIVGCGGDGAGKGPEGPGALDVGRADSGETGGTSIPDGGSHGGAGSDSGATVVEPDAAATVDGGGPGEVGTGAVDTGTSVDAGQDADVAYVADVADVADAADVADPYAGQPLGQCVQDADCPVGPSGASCSRRLPGGSCNAGCGTDAHCPVGAVCNDFGACARECGGDGDCPPGLVCGSTGQCRAMGCVNGACPVPMFGCNSSNRCERLACTLPEQCPSQTQCVNGLCVEERMLGRR